MFYSSSFDILITEDRNYLLTDFRYIEAASELKPLYDVVQVTPEYTLYDFIAEEEPLCLGLEFSSVTMNVCKRAGRAVSRNARAPLRTPTESWKKWTDG